MTDQEGAVVSHLSGVLVKPLCMAYAELLRRQGHAASPFVRWTQATGRAQNFVWLGGAIEHETLMFGGQPLVLGPGSGVFESLQKLRNAVTLNPYERELLYGYPCVIGRRNGDALRGPVLVMRIQIEGEGGELRIVPTEDVVRFNSLPFRGESDPGARDLLIRRVMERTPTFPLNEPEFQLFIDSLIHSLDVERRDARLDGSLVAEPAMPTSGGEGFWLVDQVAVFIAPKTAYFLTSDLQKISSLDPATVTTTCVGDLLGRSGPQPHVDISTEMIDRGRIYYPFPSNRSQRQAALLVDDPTTRVIRVEGPPGTGKSQTIANLACHLAATGRSVLITSQKDKALDVVDHMLRTLQLAELPMTLLRQDKSSRQDLLDRLARVKQERPRDVSRPKLLVGKTPK